MKKISINPLFDYLHELDSEKDIVIAAERLVKDNGWSKLQAYLPYIVNIKVKDV